MTAESQEVLPATQQGETDLKVQKEAFEKRALLEEWAVLERQWYITFCHLVRALADAFGEEAVLDRVENTWWELGFASRPQWRHLARSSLFVQLTFFRCWTPARHRSTFSTRTGRFLSANDSNETYVMQ